MARIRTIKPKFWDDTKIGRITRDARLLYIGLWTFADDLGVVISDPKWLRSKIFPYDQIQVQQIESWLEELEKTGFICHVTYKEETFIYLPTFSRHQVINKPNLDEVNIPKTALNAILNNNHGTITEQSRNDTVVITEQSGPIIGEEKERKNKKKSLSMSPSFQSGDTSEMSAEPTEREREDFFKIFFFKNYKNPAEQVEKFVNHYAANGWTRNNGAKVVDRIALARTWEPKDEAQKNRFPHPFIEFWRELYEQISEAGASDDDLRCILYNVKRVKEQSSELQVYALNGKQLVDILKRYAKIGATCKVRHYANNPKLCVYEAY